MKKTIKGFTLIELLVVIGILVILATLLLAGLNRAKIAADSTVCRSDLRQLMLGLKMYVQDQGAYPLAPGDLWCGLTQFIGVPFPENNYAYNNGALSYLGPRQSVFACPGYDRARGVFRGPIVSYGYNEFGNQGLNGLDWSFGLGANAPWSGPGDPPPSERWNTAPKRENQVVCPSDMIAIGDAVLGQLNSIPSGGGRFGLAFENPSYYTEIMLGQPADNPLVQAYRLRHGARWNIGFCDGHVENLAPKNLFDRSRDSVARRWNIDHLSHQNPTDPYPSD